MKGTRLAGLVPLALAPGALWAYAKWLQHRYERQELESLREPQRVARVDGVGLYYVTAGEGPAIVLIHGMGSSLQTFRRTISLLARDYRVVAFDLAGFGLSDRALEADLSPQGQACLTWELMRHLGIERASVIGHSLGGAIALHLAARHPEAVERLVLVSSAVPGHVLPSWVRPFWHPPVLEVIVALALHDPLFREWLWRGGVWDSSILTPELRAVMRQPALVRGTTRAIVRAGLALLEEEPLDLSRIAQPVLLLWGEDDRWLDLRSARRLLQALPDARLRLVPRARHMVLEERPEEAHTIILAFLRGEEEGSW
jgi:pimeloyl-ACP methyl ester carboxylesterase